MGLTIIKIAVSLVSEAKVLLTTLNETLSQPLARGQLTNTFCRGTTGISLRAYRRPFGTEL